MSDLKRIGGRSILRRLADFLGIEGVEQRAPISLDTSRLVPVVSVNPLPPLNYTGAILEALSIAAAGVATLYPLHRNADPSVAFVGNSTFGYLMDDLWFSIQFDAAGALAFNGKYLGISIFTEAENGVRMYCYVDIQALRVVTGTTNYEWSSRMAQGRTRVTADTYRGGGLLRPLLATRNRAIGIAIYAEDGTGFPANTTASIRATLHDDAGWGTLRP